MSMIMLCPCFACSSARYGTDAAGPPTSGG